MVNRSQSTSRKSPIVSTTSATVSPMPTIMPDLVTAAGSSLLALASNSRERPVVALGPHPRKYPLGRFDVVVKHVRAGIHYPGQGVA